MPRQLPIKHVCIAAVLALLAALAAAIGIAKWVPGQAPVADAALEEASHTAAVEHAPHTIESQAEPELPVVSATRSTPGLPRAEIGTARTEPALTEPALVESAQAKPTQAASNENRPDAPVQPESKGYIFYYNSPTHWTPQPLPQSVGEVRAPHANNIRAEIEQAAMLFDVDIRMMKAFARIESGYRPRATTGKYKCLFQLSDWEFAKYWKGDIYDIRDCSMAAARKLATEAAQFEKDVGRRATATEIYCIHQQGYQGCAFHYAAPHQLAWKNMYLTNEGQERGEAWARKAVWGNVPSDIKDKIEGGVEALTSAQFIAIWQERVERFMAREIEPPTYFVEQVSKAKKPSKVAGAKTGAKTKAARAKTKLAAAKTKAAGTKNVAAADKSDKKKRKTKVASR